MPLSLNVVNHPKYLLLRCYNILMKQSEFKFIGYVVKVLTLKNAE